MKHVSFQSSTNWVQCAFELSFFILIFDVTYFTVIFYEDGKFPVIDTMVSCVLLSYLTILLISVLTYSTVICCEGGGQFPVFHTSVPCVLLSCFLF